MSLYARGTSVSVDRSKQDIESVLKRYGADQFMYGWKEDMAIIGFRAHERMIRFELPIPDKSAFKRTASGRMRHGSSATIDAAHDQAIRQRWRALVLVIKAKLEAVASGITTFEDEFLAHIVLATGETLGAWIRPQLPQHYENKQMPRLLPGVNE